MWRVLGLAMALVVFSGTASADGNFAQHTTITLKLAQAMAAAMTAKAEEKGVDVVIYIAGADGRPLLLHRDEDSGFAPLEWAKNKAITAYQTRRQTKDLAEKSRILRMDTFSYTMGLPGGIPLVIDGARAGAIGVSGAKVSVDQEIAEAGLAVFEAALE